MSRAKWIIFDLETCRSRNPEALKRIERAARERVAPHNTLKAKKEAWDTPEAVQERAQDAVAKTSTDVLYAEVLCACWMTDTDEDPGCADCMGGGRLDPVEAEREGLRAFARDLDAAAASDTVWIGHNILDFDLPVLLNRWRRHDIQPPEHFPVYHNGRWSGRIYDTMRRVPTKTGFVSLDEACVAYGLGAGKNVECDGQVVTGADVGPMYEAGKYRQIIGYCMSDVLVVRGLFDKLTCRGRYGLGGRLEEIAEQVAEIEDSDLSEGRKAMAILAVLDRAGMVPRPSQN